MTVYTDSNKENVVRSILLHCVQFPEVHLCTFNHSEHLFFSTNYKMFPKLRHLLMMKANFCYQEKQTQENKTFTNTVKR